MLVLARNEGQKIVLRDDRLDADIEIYLVLVDQRKSMARIGIVADDQTMILREEISDITKFTKGSTLRKRQQDRQEKARRRKGGVPSLRLPSKTVPKSGPGSGPERLPGRGEGGADRDADRNGKD